MPANKRLYDYLSQHADEISSTWYQNIEENDPNSIYASTDPVIIENLKRQNLAFNHHINRIFIDEEHIYLPALKNWAFQVTQDQEHLKTPIHYIIREFVRVRDLYLTYVKAFIRQEEANCESAEDISHTLMKAFDLVIHIFIEEMSLFIKRHFKKRLNLAVSTFLAVSSFIALCKIRYNKLNIWGSFGGFLIGQTQQRLSPSQSLTGIKNLLLRHSHSHNKKPYPGLLFFIMCQPDALLI